MKKIILSLLVLILATMTRAAERFVVFTPEADAMLLSSGTISYSESDYEGVKIAIRNLQADLKNTLGIDQANILIGTIGKNKDIDKLKLADLKGKREKYIITTVDNQLIIAGSDRRGTIYGIYELSQQLGVSPWYYWADATVEISPGRDFTRFLSLTSMCDHLIVASC